MIRFHRAQGSGTEIPGSQPGNLQTAAIVAGT